MRWTKDYVENKITTGVMRESWNSLDKETEMKKPLGAWLIRISEAD